LGAKIPNKLVNDRRNGVIISAVAFSTFVRKNKKQQKIKIFAASLIDIQKALALRRITNSRKKLSFQYYDFLKIFDRAKANILLPIRGNGINHNIIFEKINRKKTQIP
jgi:hypothetical protein